MTLYSLAQLAACHKVAQRCYPLTDLRALLINQEVWDDDAVGQHHPIGPLEPWIFFHHLIMVDIHRPLPVAR
jgi:hypothetical protein